LYEVFETEEEFFLVMELVDGKELFDKIVERGQVKSNIRGGEAEVSLLLTSIA
jgi:serine/threonine protein kinase